MDCTQIKQAIPAYVNHTASQDQINAVEEHLCICDSCRQHLQKIMDKDTVVVPKKEPGSASSDKNIGSFEYLVLGAGILILLFFVFLLMRR
jgi:predicted anti-sigma-YlaC factor YlaD